MNTCVNCLNIKKTNKQKLIVNPNAAVNFR